MAWHSRSPWAAKREAEHAETVQQMRRLIETYENGGISFRRLKEAIDEVIHTDTAAVVRVGNATHKPEVRS